MRRFFLFLSLFLMLRPSFVLATDGADLGLPASKIRFSKETLVAGDTVRVYATVENKGTEDVSGYVLFYAGSEEVGKSQIVSVVSGGQDEQVWVDFTVPYGAFNMRAELEGTDPVDINSANDLALTALYSPMIDEDRDGIGDEEDNCPEAANANQQDTDSDGNGNVCDTDDDNDGLSDAVEEEMATDPLVSDTDGDGVKDAVDAYPTDATRQKKEAPTIVASPVVVATPPTATPEISSSTSSSAPASSSSSSSSEAADPFSEIHLANGGSFQLSPRAAFAFVQEDWKTYAFQSLSVLTPGASLAWDFGDGVTSAADQVTHVFRQPGTYEVILRITSADGSLVEDRQTITISTFHLGNPLIQISLALLSLLFCLSGVFVLRRSRVERNKEGKVVADAPASNKKKRS